MGFTKPTNLEQFQQSVVGFGSTPVLLKFSADWCAPCQLIAPELDKLAEEFKDRMGFIYVDVDALPEVQELYEVVNLPTHILIINCETKGSAYGTKVDQIR